MPCSPARAGEQNRPDAWQLSSAKRCSVIQASGSIPICSGTPAARSFSMRDRAITKLSVACSDTDRSQRRPAFTPAPRRAPPGCILLLSLLSAAALLKISVRQRRPRLLSLFNALAAMGAVHERRALRPMDGPRTRKCTLTAMACRGSQIVAGRLRAWRST